MNRSGIRRSRFRTGALAASATQASVAALTACGGSGDTAPVTGTPSSSLSAARASNAAQLDELSLTASDLQGFSVRESAAYEVITQDHLRPGEADCVEVNRAMWGVALGDPAATALRRVDSEFDDSVIDAAETEEELDAAFVVTSTSVSLASYADESEAKAALKALRGSVATCDGGFTSSGAGRPDAVITDPAPDAGDEAVAFTVTADGEDDPMGPTKVVVFRHGGILAQFNTVNTAATVSTNTWDFPTVLVETQEKKLG